MRVRLNQQRLLAFLAQSRLSQNHWALKLGLSRGHWSEIVNGKHPYPSPKTRERMLEVLGIPFDELFEIETEVPSWVVDDVPRGAPAGGARLRLLVRPFRAEGLMMEVDGLLR